MWRLLTFGGLAVETRDGSAPPRVRPQRLAILSVLAASDRGVSRERMLSLFWPDADEERARPALRQALYALRQELGADLVQSESVLTLDRDRMRSDVGEFRVAVGTGDYATAAALARGSFLDGFFLPGAPGFERWVEDERGALRADTAKVLLALAREAETRAELETAVEWWRRLTALDPLSGSYALGFLRALAARGDRAGALRFAREHESVVRRELEADPDPEIRRLEAELRARPSPVIEGSAPVRTPTPVPPFAAPAPVAGVPGDEAPDHGSPQPERDGRWSPWTSKRILAVSAFGVVALAVTLATDWGRGAPGPGDRGSGPFAVGMIREEGVPDTLRIGGVLTDMLATNLARVAGLSVLANTRLFELMRPGQDTLSVGYLDAARRAGATEIFQGRLLAGPQWSLALEMQRVEIATGIVRGAYRVQANDRYALVDSMTTAIARDLRLRSPGGSVAEATTASPTAYRLYEEGLRALYQYDQAAALRLFSLALQEDSTFAMAAYHEALLRLGGDASETARRARAVQLARRLPEQQRLIVTAELLAHDNEPAAFAVAESLTLKYPGEPRSYETMSKAYAVRGEWAEARTAIERAIAIDSATEPVERQACRLCEDLNHLANIYVWWDSLAAAERTAHRYLRLRPGNHDPWQVLTLTAALRGDSDATSANLRKVYETNPVGVSPLYIIRNLILAGEYEEAERQLLPLYTSPRPLESGEAQWFRTIVFRNQGRLAEASRYGDASIHDIPGAVVAMEAGDHRRAVLTFRQRANSDYSAWGPGTAARLRTWNTTLLAMVLLAAGDTNELRQLADTVEYWGQRSNYGRDRRAHHYIRGMLLVRQGRDTEAAAELREAIHSPTNGFTRVNLELGRALLRLLRPQEAVPIVRAALHGEVDGSSLYVTRTELHELLAQAFDQAGQRDSAAVHYRAVVKAWAHADPMFLARRDQARAWLVRYGLPR